MVVTNIGTSPATWHFLPPEELHSKTNLKTCVVQPAVVFNPTSGTLLPTETTIVTVTVSLPGLPADLKEEVSNGVSVFWHVNELL